jgi:hypothetical protein
LRGYSRRRSCNCGVERRCLGSDFHRTACPAGVCPIDAHRRCIRAAPADRRIDVRRILLQPDLVQGIDVIRRDSQCRFTIRIEMSEVVVERAVLLEHHDDVVD